MKNIKRENKSKLTLFEEIYSTLGNILGGEYLFVGSMQIETLEICVCVSYDSNSNSNSQVFC